MLDTTDLPPGTCVSKSGTVSVHTIKASDLSYSDRRIVQEKNFYYDREAQENVHVQVEGECTLPDLLRTHAVEIAYHEATTAATNKLGGHMTVRTRMIVKHMSAEERTSINHAIKKHPIKHGGWRYAGEPHFAWVAKMSREDYRNLVVTSFRKAPKCRAPGAEAPRDLAPGPARDLAPQMGPASGVEALRLHRQEEGKLQAWFDEYTTWFNTKKAETEARLALAPNDPEYRQACEEYTHHIKKLAEEGSTDYPPPPPLPQLPLSR